MRIFNSTDMDVSVFVYDPLDRGFLGVMVELARVEINRHQTRPITGIPGARTSVQLKVITRGGSLTLADPGPTFRTTDELQLTAQGLGTPEVRIEATSVKYHDVFTWDIVDRRGWEDPSIYNLRSAYRSREVTTLEQISSETFSRQLSLGGGLEAKGGGELGVPGGPTLKAGLTSKVSAAFQTAVTSSFQRSLRTESSTEREASTGEEITLPPRALAVIGVQTRYTYERGRCSYMGESSDYVRLTNVTYQPADLRTYAAKADIPNEVRVAVADEFARLAA